MTSLMTSPRIDDRDRYDSAADYAYAALREEIVAGRFVPGRRMREIELSTLLGISRTPTRQALSRLEIEGLLDLRPRVGLVVASLDAEAIEELYEMRSALEGTAAGLAARHASARDVDVLRRLLDEEARLPEDGETRYRHNVLFHDAIYAAANNRFLVKSLQVLNDSIALLGPTTLGVPGRARIAHDEHRLLLDAIADKDMARAEAVARTHVDGAFALRKAMLAARPAGAHAPL